MPARDTAWASASKGRRLTFCEGLPGIWPPPRCCGYVLIHPIPPKVEGELGPQEAQATAVRPHNWHTGEPMQLDTSSVGKDSNPALFSPVSHCESDPGCFSKSKSSKDLKDSMKVNVKYPRKTNKFVGCVLLNKMYYLGQRR